MGPCMCGDTECASCGPAQQTLSAPRRVVKLCQGTTHRFPQRICPCGKCAARRELALVRAQERYLGKESK